MCNVCTTVFIQLAYQPDICTASSPSQDCSSQGGTVHRSEQGPKMPPEERVYSTEYMQLTPHTACMCTPVHLPYLP